MIKKDRYMSDSWQIVCKSKPNISASVVLIYELFINTIRSKNNSNANS